MDREPKYKYENLPTFYDITLQPYESKCISGSIRFVDPNTEAYSKVKLSLSLELGDLKAPM